MSRDDLSRLRLLVSIDTISTGLEPQRSDVDYNSATPQQVDAYESRLHEYNICRARQINSFALTVYLGNDNADA